MTGGRDWVVSRTNPEFLDYFSRALRISRVTAQILLNRGINEPETARGFLCPSARDLHDPLLLTDMGRAVERIRGAVKGGERIAVYGDYDVDGLTATAVLTETLRALGTEPLWHIPDRLKEGYGLSETGLRKIADAGASLVITVDCGISAVEEARFASRCNMDMVITDHHHPGEVLPDAVAVVNPRRPGDRYPFRELAGVGVAWKLASALLGAERADEMIDLAALGTVADVVPLVGEHRWIVRRGLERMEAGMRPGLRALRKVTGVDRRRLGSAELAFVFGPRINAAGRLGDAMPVVDLLTTDDDEKAEVLAAFLNRNNQIRQGIEQKVLESVERALEREPADEAVILFDQEWHPGVVGIVAARLCERLDRPVFLLSARNGVARGSGRSPEGLHLMDVLDRCSDLLIEFGGHAQAAGLTIRVDDIPRFQERFREIYAGMRECVEGRAPLRLESAVDFRQIRPGFLDELSRLEPFGCGNEEPLFGARGVEVVAREATKNNHLRLRFRQAGVTIDGIAFSRADTWHWIREGDRLDLAFTPIQDRWNGRTAVKLRVRDVRRPA